MKKKTTTTTKQKRMSRIKIITTALQELEEKLGRQPSPKELVVAAKNPKHRMHKFFDWNIERAAMGHWVNQASGFIREVKVVLAPSNNPQYQVEVPRFRSEYSQIASKNERSAGGSKPVWDITDSKARTRHKADRIAAYCVQITNQTKDIGAMYPDIQSYTNKIMGTLKELSKKFGPAEIKQKTN